MLVNLVGLFAGCPSSGLLFQSTLMLQGGGHRVHGEACRRTLPPACAHLGPVVLHLKERHHLGGVERVALLHALLALPALAVRLALDERLAGLAAAVPAVEAKVRWRARA